MNTNETTYAQEIILKRMVEKQNLCPAEFFQFHDSDDYSDYSDYSDYVDYGDNINYSFM